MIFQIHEFLIKKKIRRQNLPVTLNFFELKA